MTMRKRSRHPPTMASAITQNCICLRTGPAPITATNVSTCTVNNTAQLADCTELVTTGLVELRWVAGCEHCARSDSTQPVELSWVRSGAVIRALNIETLRINHSCSVHMIRIIRLEKNSRIFTNFIMDINVRNNYGINNYPLKITAVPLDTISLTTSHHH